MYYYILDPKGIDVATFEKNAVILSGLLAEFGILGEMARVSNLRRIPDLVEIAASRGVRTLVACGSDDTFNQVLASLKGRNFILAFIAFDSKSMLAKIFGVTDMMAGVKAIASRRIESIDLAKINNTFFISFLEFGVMSRATKRLNFWNYFRLLSEPKINLEVRIDDAYNMTVECVGGLLVNSRYESSDSDVYANPTDGQLELMILEDINKSFLIKYKEYFQTQKLELTPNATVIKCRSVRFLKPENLQITMLSRLVAKSPTTAELKENRLRVIVGKDRTFNLHQ